MTTLSGWQLAFAFLIFPGIVFTSLVGLTLTWVDRFVSARVQWRKGPPFFQPYADMLKLLLKQTVVPAGASKVTFLAAPLIGFAAMCVTAVLLVFQHDRKISGKIDELILSFRQQKASSAQTVTTPAAPTKP